MTGDERLGSALRELPVPAHGPRFWERLEAALEDDVRSRRARARRRPWRLAVAAGVAAAAIVAALIGLPRGEAPAPALADQLKTRVRSAIESLQDVRASGRARFGDDPLMRFSFALTAEGDVLLRQPGFRAIAYEADRGVERQIIGSDRPRPDALYVERRGVAPGPPDLTPTQVPASQQLGAAVRALLAADDPRVTETTWRGRVAWLAVIAVEPDAGAGAIDRLRVVVDRQTGLPVRILGSREGRPVYETVIERLEVNTGIPAGAFALRFPPSAEVAINRERFDRVTLAEARSMLPYNPLVPSWVPDGYEVADVAVAERDRFTGRAPESGDSNPRGRHVLSLIYRHGFDQLTVTTRRAEGQGWGDPFRATGEPTDVEPVTLAGGALAGADGELVVGPGTLPHLWTLEDGLLVTVGGDLSRDDLVRVAESLATG